MSRRMRYLVAGGLVAVSVTLAGLALWRTGQPADVASSPLWIASVTSDDIQRETRLIEAGDVMLEAEILVPAGGAAVKPAVVVTPGSGDSLVQAYRGDFLITFIQNVFLPRDITVVLVNKRGMGGSTGNWYRNTMEGRAGDLAHVVAYLRGRDDIVPNGIGIAGHSQGGWAAVELAAHDPRIAYMIDLMGPVRPTWDHFITQWRQVYACRDYQGVELDRALRWKIASTRIANLAGTIIPVGQIGFDARFFRYDPTDSLLSLTQPSLFVFGERDALVAPGPNVARLYAIHDQTLPPDQTVTVVPAAGHHGEVLDDPCSPFNGDFGQGPSPDMIAAIEDFLTRTGY